MSINVWSLFYPSPRFCNTADQSGQRSYLIMLRLLLLVNSGRRIRITMLPSQIQSTNHVMRQPTIDIPSKTGRNRRNDTKRYGRQKDYLERIRIRGLECRASDRQDLRCDARDRVDGT